MSRMPRICWSPGLLASFLVAGLAFQTACNSSSTPATGNGTPAGPASAAGPRSARYEDLVSLFADWRAFQRPKVVSGVPDYSAPAMATQYKDLAAYRARLLAIDPSGWPIPQQVD